MLGGTALYGDVTDPQLGTPTTEDSLRLELYEPGAEPDYKQYSVEHHKHC